MDSISVALSLCRFPRDTRNEFTKVFLSGKEQFGYYTLDLDRRTFSRTHLSDPVGGETSGDLSASSSVPGRGNEKTSSVVNERLTASRLIARLDASRFFPHMENPEKAALLHDLILPHLGTIAPDYTVEMRSNKTGRSVRLSVLDYIDIVTSEKKTPGEIMSSYHRFITSLLSLPSCLVVNRRLSSR